MRRLIVSLFRRAAGTERMLGRGRVRRPKLVKNNVVQVFVELAGRRPGLARCGGRGRDDRIWLERGWTVRGHRTCRARFVQAALLEAWKDHRGRVEVGAHRAPTQR